MLASLLLLASHALVASHAGNASPGDPPVRVWFNADGNYAFADRAKVYARSAEGGYLIVLRADADGRVRVLFPVDPRDDQRIAAGRKYELKGRGGREAFIADDSAGHGTVLAAVSTTPFQVDRFTRDGHWDLRQLGGSRGGEDDAEVVLRDIAERMKPTGERFVYSVATYVVSERFARDRYVDSYAARWRFDPFWGYRTRLGLWYRPWY